MSKEREAKPRQKRKTRKERKEEAQNKLEALFRTTENLYRSGPNSYIFTVETIINKQIRKAIIAYDDFDNYINTLLFWPEREEGKLSSNVLWMYEDHEGDDDYYHEDALYREFAIMPIAETDLRLGSSGGINIEAANKLIDIRLYSPSQYHPAISREILDANKLLGEIKFDTLKPLF